MIELECTSDNGLGPSEGSHLITKGRPDALEVRLCYRLQRFNI